MSFAKKKNYHVSQSPKKYDLDKRDNKSHLINITVCSCFLLKQLLTEEI